MKKLLILILCTSLGFAAIACKEQENNSEDNKTKIEAEPLEQQLLMANKGDLLGTLQINQTMIKKMKPVKLRLDLKKNGKQFAKSSIKIDLTMPAMKMPKNEIELKETAEGIYTGEAIFTMRGDWELNAYIEAEGQQEKLVFATVVE